MPFVGVSGLILLCLGVYALFKGSLGRMVITRKTAGWMVASGFACMVGAGIGGGYSSSSASAAAFLGWVAICATIYLLVTGSIGPVQGRQKSLIFLLIALLLFPIASTIQGRTDKVIAVKKEQEEAARTEQRYQEAVAVFQQQKWSQAISSFETIQPYKDSTALLHDSRYALAVELVQGKSWDQAEEHLSRLPKDHKDVTTLLGQVKDGKTADLFAAAMKAKDEENYVEAERLLIKAQQAGGSVSGNLDSELATVVALRKKAEEEEAERAAREREHQARIDAQAGSKPSNSSWDAAVAPVVSFLKVNLKDPKSVEYIEWSPVTLLELDGQFFWGVRCKYRAKNSFGGYVIEEKVFLIQHDKVVKTMDL